MEVQNVKVEHMTMPGRQCLTLRTKGFNTATINGFRRIMLLNVKCYGFVEELDPVDYKIITGTKEEHRNTILACTLNSQSIPVLAQRCSRLAIHTDDVTGPLLKSDDERKVFFVICQKPESSGDDLKSLMTKPLIVNDKLTHIVYSRDLLPVVLVKVQDDDEDPRYEYNKEQSDIVKGNMDRIFQYNELIAQINHGQKLNIILKPVLGTGTDNVRWAPCTFLYRFEMDPKWLQMNHGVVEKGQIRRKIEGERSFKHLFIHKPPLDEPEQPASLDTPYDRFGKPYGHILTFQYNGKMNEVTTFYQCADVLIGAVDLFLKRYLEADTEASMMSKDTSTVSSEDSNLNSIVEQLYIPKNTQDKMPDEDYILTDHAIGNMITTKMLEIVDSLITSKRLTDDLWSQTHIAYKIPHPLIKQCLIIIKIPETLGITHEKLIIDTVQAIKMDIKSLTDAVHREISLDRV